MATIAKSKQGTWRALVRRKGWPPVTKTFRTRRDAEAWARATEDEIIRGIYIARNHSEQTSIEAALHRYRKEVTPLKSKTTQQAEKLRASRLVEHLGKYSLASLSAAKIASYRDARIEQGKSTDTVRLELALLSHVYTTAIKEWGLGLVVNPVLNIRKPAPGRPRERRLVGDEETRLLQACDNYSNPMLGWIVRIALYTGMRRSEILGLTESQVSIDRRAVLLYETKNGTSRTVPLTIKACSIFKQVLENPIRPKDTNLLFYGDPGRDGKRRPYQFSKVWKEILVDIEIENFRFHDLRHEATSRFVEAGLSDLEVSSITGHKSLQMLKRYTHLRSENLASKIAGI